MAKRKLKKVYRDGDVRYYYPVNIDLLADDLARWGKDIAPTRRTWTALADDIASAHGELGREAFHKIAAVWPDYNRHDSELCYNRAVRHADDSKAGMPYLKAACRSLGIDVNSPRYRKGAPLKRLQGCHKKKTESKKVMIDKEFFKQTQRCGRPLSGRCQLTDLLLRVLPQQAVIDTVDDYLLGFDSYRSGQMGDAAIFWQVDDKYNIINGKRIYYKFDGHRDKRYNPWLIYSTNGQCLYGLHLLPENDGRKIAIVESEKSAIVMAIVMPSYLWMATGSLDNFNESMLLPLRDYKVIAFPDLDQKRARGQSCSYTFAQWREMAVKLNSKGWSITIDDSLEKNANTAMRLAKWDIADLTLQDKINSKIKIKL